MPHHNNGSSSTAAEQEHRSTQDRKDLERFSKFFTMKVVQVVVQSRLGEKMKCASRANSSGADWFNLSIDDNLEVLKETKIAIGTSSLPNPAIVVEIILKTSDSKKLTLELWSVYFTESLKEQNARILYTVYNRMTLLLKSLITVTRVLPAYKLSRMKGDYFIEYSVYSGNAMYNNLGKECRVTTLGSVSTPYGSICVEFGYRTKMEISFEQCPVICKEDHFDVIDSAHQPVIEPVIPIPRSPNSTKIPAFSEPFPLLTTEFDEDDIPFSNLLKRSTNFSNHPEPDDAKMSPPEIQHEIDSSFGDDPNPAFEFIEIKPPPFAPELPDSDPAAFFATLQNAPPLMSLPNIEIREIDDQMLIFEENLGFFDDFVQKLCVKD